MKKLIEKKALTIQERWKQDSTDGMTFGACIADAVKKQKREKR